MLNTIRNTSQITAINLTEAQSNGASIEDDRPPSAKTTLTSILMSMGVPKPEPYTKTKSPCYIMIRDNFSL